MRGCDDCGGSARQRLRCDGCVDDELRTRLAATAHPVGVAAGAMEWRAFAKKADGSIRWRAQPSNPSVIRSERPCYFVPGKWRALARLGRAQLPADVLVALDMWLEGGAKRMSRPTVIP